MKKTLAVVALSLLTLSATAQDAEAPRLMPLQVIPAREGFRLTSRILFVVDRSSSMSGKLEAAVQACLLILVNPSDDFRVGIISFDHGFERWNGRPSCTGHAPPPGLALVREFTVPRCTEKCVPPGWAQLPSDYQAAVDWLNGLTPAGSTTPHPPLEAAFKDPVQGLTVVFISDGEGYRGEHCVAAVSAGRAWRKQHGLNEAAVMVWGVGDGARDRSSLRLIAKVGGGGMWAPGEKSGPW